MPAISGSGDDLFPERIKSVVASSRNEHAETGDILHRCTAPMFLALHDSAHSSPEIRSM
jgi:hypothetical protein